LLDTSSLRPEYGLSRPSLARRSPHPVRGRRRAAAWSLAQYRPLGLDS